MVLTVKFSLLKFDTTLILVLQWILPVWGLLLLSHLMPGLASASALFIFCMTGPLPCTEALIILQLCGDLHDCLGLHMKLHCSCWLISNYFLFLLIPSAENLLQPLVMQELLLGLLACAWSSLPRFLALLPSGWVVVTNSSFFYEGGGSTDTPNFERRDISRKSSSQSQMDSSWLEHQNHKAMLINKQTISPCFWMNIEMKACKKGRLEFQYFLGYSACLRSALTT